jgi:hypothetical protein
MDARTGAVNFIQIRAPPFKVLSLISRLAEHSNLDDWWFAFRQRTVEPWLEQEA